MTETTLHHLKQFVAAYLAIVNLLKAAFQNWPREPKGWNRYVEYLDALNQHRADVAALLIRYGQETAADAGRHVANLVEGCAWAKSECEQLPCPQAKLGAVRDYVVKSLDPIRQFLALKTQELEDRVQVEAAVVSVVASREPSGGKQEEWLPAGKAVERANEAGYTISVTWLTRDAKKHGIKVRLKQLPGQHKKEVEWNGLAGYLVKEKAAQEVEPDNEGIEKRIQEAHELRQKARPTD